MAKWDTKNYGFGSSLNSPDYSGAFSSKKDGAFSNAWKTGFGVNEDKSKNNLGEIIGGLFNKAKNTDKYRDESQRPSFGEATRGGGGQLLENLSALYPSQHAPMFIPGQESKGGVGGIIGTVAGAALGSIVPGVGTALGAKLGGGIGGMFG